MKIITGQMIRDLLAFKGDLSIKGLEVALKASYAEFAGPLARAIERGDIKEYVFNDLVENTPPLLMFTTDWIDNVA